jgi:outer membrane protein OmpU
MKKILYGTTALVAAGMISSAASAADPIKLSVGGHMWQFFGFVDMDDNAQFQNTRTNEFASGSDVEVYFSGETKLDNGLIVGARIELEAERSSVTPNARNADMQYAYIKGGFGEISLGDRIMVQNLVHNNAPGFGIDWTNTRNMFIPETLAGGAGNNPTAGYAATPYGEHRTDFDGLASRGTSKLQYVSPVLFGGFTGAVIYVPNATATGQTNVGGSGRGAANELTNNHDLLGAAVAYKGKPLWGVDVGADVGYARMQRANGNTTVSNGYVQAWSAGLVLGYAGFKAGGSAMLVDDKINVNVGNGVALLSTATSLDGITWDAGASYEWGNWGVSYTYFNATVAGLMGANSYTTAGLDNRGDDKTQFHKVAVMYKMGPGIVTDLSLVYGEYENEGGDKAANNGAANGRNETDGFALVGGLRLAF